MDSDQVMHWLLKGFEGFVAMLEAHANQAKPMHSERLEGMAKTLERLQAVLERERAKWRG